MNQPDRAKTLDELDPPAWGAPEHDTHLIETCHRLRGKPLGDFSVEDLRIMIGQGVGLRWLVPIAIEALEQDPLVEGDLYPGDLLASLLKVDQEFWTRRSGWRDGLQAVLEGLPSAPDELHDAVATFRGHTT